MRLVKVLQAVIVIALLMVAVSDTRSQHAAEYVPRQVIVKMRVETLMSGVDEIQTSLNTAVVKRFRLTRAELWEISGMSVEEAVLLYRNDPRIEYIEPNYILHAENIAPDDPFFHQLWGLHNTGQRGGTADADIDAPEAWEIAAGNGVIIGVIDTGVDWLHEDLSANIWTNTGEIPNNNIDDDGNGYVDDVRGWDFVNNDNNPMDDHGHGTHVSGTIAGVGDNGIGVTGVCWAARIMPLKFIGADGMGTTADAIDAIEYATMMGAKLTSNSWGGVAYSSALREAIEASGDAGMLFIAAAGNDGLFTDFRSHYPSGYDLGNIISVAATDHNDNLASFSNYGATSVDLAAPGVDILSTLPNDSYGSKDGTSMATPHVSGVAGLLWSVYPELSHLEIRDRILAAVDSLPSLSGKTVTGGRLNAFNALAEPDSIPPSAVSDLATLDHRSNSIRLTWTASGDDGGAGQAVEYDIRHSLSPIDSGTFDSATEVDGAPRPQPPGVSESFTVHGLDFSTTYYFAVKVFDEWGNSSAVSNTPSGTTLAIPSVDVSPDSLFDSLLAGGTSAQILTIRNIGAGTLDFSVSIGGETSAPEEPMTLLYTLTPPRADAATPDGEKSAAAPAVGAALTAPLANLTGKEIMYDRSHGQISGIYWSTIIGDLTARGATVTVNNDSITSELLAGYDVVWSVDVGVVWSAAELSALSNWVKTGGGLLLEGDDSADDFNALLGALEAGIEYAPEGVTNGTTTNIHPHETTEDVSSIYLEDAHAHLASIVQPAVRLVEDLTGVPNTAYSLVGLGRVIAMAEELSMNGPVGGADNQLFVNQIFDWLALDVGWATAAPASGTVTSGDSVNVVVSFDAGGLYGGDYGADLIVASNDPVTSEVSVPVRLHVTGVPDIAVADSLLDFGQVYIGFSTDGTLVISNVGPDSLTVSGMAVDNSIFNVDTSGFFLGAGESRDLNVEYAPDVTGMAAGVLTIYSDDPDEPVVNVSLLGEGLEAPVLVVSPELFSESLSTGETSSHAMTIRNDGGSELEWNLLRYRASSAMMRKVFTLTPPKLVATGPDGEETAALHDSDPALQLTAMLADLSGVSILLDQSHSQPPEQPTPDEWATIIADLTTRGAAVTINNDSISTELLTDYDVVWMMDMSVDWESAELDALADWVEAGGGLIFEGDQSSARFNTLLAKLGAGIEYAYDRGMSGSTTTIYPHETTRGVDDIYIHNNLAYLYDVMHPAVCLIEDAAGLRNTACTLVGSGRIVAMAEELFHDNLIAKSDNQLFANQVFDWLALGVNWVSALPASGTLTAGDSVSVEVTFDAAGLAGGDYDAALIIESNDPVTPETSMLTHLQVIGAPDIALSDSILNYGRIFIGATCTDTVVISNTGADTLVVDEVLIDNAAFSADVSGFVLDAGGSRELVVVFTPGAEGVFAGTLTVMSNDPDEPVVAVSLQGEGLGPPEIVVTPASLSDSLSSDSTSVHILTIENTGENDLVFSIVESTAGLSVTGTRVLTSKKTPMRNRILDQGRFTNSGVSYNDGRSPIRKRFDAHGILGGSGAVIGKRLLILGSNGDVSEIMELLSSYPDFSVVDDFEGFTATPSLEDLSMYHCVVVMNESPFHDAAAVGDVLADYVDIGGAVVLTLASFIEEYAVTGRFQSDGYSPFAGSGGPNRTADLGSYDVDHPIMSGVTTATGDLLGNVSLTEGAVWVADWDNGLPLAATKGNNVAGVNVYVATPAYWLGDVPLILRNAILWAIREGICWISVDSPADTIPAHSIKDVAVTFDAGATCVFGGEYFDSLVVESNDPIRPKVYVPVHLHVTGEPDITVSEQSIDFGLLLIGSTASDTFVILNVGTDNLVVSGVQVSNPAFSADTSGFVLSPLDSMELVVEFTPDVAGSIVGDLDIYSNDPDESLVGVSLLGEGAPTPGIAVHPDSLEESLSAGGTSTQTVTIRQDGEGDLAWDIHFVIASGETAQQYVPIPPDAGAAGSDGAGVNFVPAAKRTKPLVVASADLTGVSIGYDRKHGQSLSSNWSTIIADLTARGATVTDNGSIITPETLAPYNVFWITGHHIPFWDSELEALTDWFNAGGAVLLEGDYYDSELDEIATALGAGIHYSSYDGTSGVTSNVFPHETTRNVETILIQDSGARLSLSGSAVCLIDDIDNVPNAACDIVGSGTVVAMADKNFKNDRINSEDNRLFANQVFGWLGVGASWLSAGSFSGTISEGDSVSVEITFDAGNLCSGDYFSDLVIESSDPVAPEVCVPVHLHVTGIPDITLSNTLLDFGQSFVGATVREMLVVSNSGTDGLVVSGLTINNAAFSADTSGFVLEPDENRNLIVEFTPDEIGQIQGMMTINSNDPNKSTVYVMLRGTGLPPPVISVSPDSLSDSLFVGGTSEHALTVRNEGPGDLEWSILFHAPGSGPADLTGVAVMYDRSHGQNASSYWSTIVSDLESRGATVTENTVAITDFVLAGYNVVWMTWSETWTTNEVFALLEWIHRGGGLLLEGHSSDAFNGILGILEAGIEYGPIFSYGNPGATTNICPHATTEGVAGIYLGSVLTYLSAVTPPAVRLIDDVGGVANSACSEIGLGRIVASAEQMFSNSRIDYLNNRLFANQVFDWVAARVSWVTADPAYGTIPPVDSIEVTVTFDAGVLGSGGYDAVLVVGSCLPPTPEMFVPLHLQILGAPGITVSDSVLDYGTVFLGCASSDTLIITNYGAYTLVVSGVVLDNESFSADTSGFALGVGESRELNVDFAPDETGLIEGTLTIISNDPDEPVIGVVLRGTGAAPPVIAVFPTSLDENLSPGETSMQTLTIRNEGVSVLEWSIQFSPGLTAPLYAMKPPKAGTIDPGGGEAAALTVENRARMLQSAPADLSGVEIMYDVAHGQSSSAGRTEIIADLIARGAAVTENGAPITLELLVVYDIVWTTDMAGTWTSVERSALINWVTAGGGLLLEGKTDSSVTAFNSILTPLQAGIEYSTVNGSHGTTWNIYPHVTTEGVASVFIYFNYASLSTVTAPAFRLVDDDNHVPNTACSEVGLGRIAAMADDAKFDNNRIDVDHNRLFANQVFDWLALGANWLAIDPRSGTVTPGDSVNIAVAYDAGGISIGDYGTFLVVECNDPVTPKVTIPANLHVIVPDTIAPEVTVVYPNGGEVFGIDSTLYIEWIATDNRSVDSVSIFCSFNGGAGFELITSGESNNSPYRWIVPDTISDSCLIKIMAFDPGLLIGEDTSDSLFSIQSTPGGNGDETPSLPYALEQNFPNPFNPSTRIVFSIGEAGHVSLRLFDSAGRLIRVLVDERREAGRHEELWDGKSTGGRAVASGIYFYCLVTGDFMQTRKMVLLR